MSAKAGVIVVQKGRVKEWTIPYSIYHYQAPREGAPYVADCPMLHLASHGQTVGEARRSFDNLVSTYLKELANMGTLDKVLAEWGWRKREAPVASGHRSASRRIQMPVQWIPPRVLGGYSSVSHA